MHRFDHRTGGQDSLPALVRDGGGVMLVLLAAALMAQLDLFIVNVAVPDLLHAFPSAGIATVSWTLNAYTIVFAALLIPAGRLADELGRRRSLLLGVATFTVASGVCAAAPSVQVLIGARAMQAVGAAMLMPVSLAMILELFGSERHALIVGLWAAMGGAAATLGPSVGGVLLELSWRWIFLVNLPIGAFVLIAGHRRLAPSTPNRTAGLPDLTGALALAGAVALAVLAIVEGQTWGWGSRTTLASVLGAGALAAVFAWRNHRHARPLVEWSLFRTREFATANAAMVPFYTAMACMLLVSFLFMQEQWGYSALRAGLAFAPGGLTSMVCALSSGSLTRAIGRRRLAVCGPLFLAAAGVWWLASMGARPDYLTGFLPGIVLAGLGTGTSQAPLFAAVSALPGSRAATASAMLTTTRQISSTLGVAVPVALLAGTPTLGGFRDGWWLIAGASLASSLISLLGAQPVRERPVLDLRPHRL